MAVTVNRSGSTFGRIPNIHNFVLLLRILAKHTTGRKRGKCISPNLHEGGEEEVFGPWSRDARLAPRACPSTVPLSSLDWSLSQFCELDVAGGLNFQQLSNSPC